NRSSDPEGLFGGRIHLFHPRLVNDFQEMVKKYLVEQVGIPDVKKVEVRVTKIF
ncbi:unnamed protein product, partial [marine sediment metagenome]